MARRGDGGGVRVVNLARESTRAVLQSRPLLLPHNSSYVVVHRDHAWSYGMRGPLEYPSNGKARQHTDILQRALHHDLIARRWGTTIVGS